MKKMKYRLIGTIAVMLFTLSAMISCVEDYTYTEEYPDQMFRPYQLQRTISDNEVSLSWKATGTSYILELSRDSLVFANDLQVVELVNAERDHTFKNLWSNSLYSVRLKTVSTNSGIKDSEYNEITFVTGTENIFYIVKVEDISANSVLLKWNNAKDVSKIVVMADGAAEISMNLSANEIAEGQKLIDGLTPGIKYSFKIYLGEMLRGTLTFGRNAQPKTINVNFGSTSSDLTWNNVLAKTVDLTSLIDSVGNATEIDLNVYDKFTTEYSSLAPFPGIPDDVGGSFLIGNSTLWRDAIEPTAGLQFKNLDPDIEYTLVLYSGRAITTYIMETQFVITGATSTTFVVNSVGNITPISGKFYPASDGTLKIDVSAGPNNNITYKYYHLNAIKLSYISY